MSPDCLFCRIVRGEARATKVYEDDDAFAFEDIAPKSPTHVLVVPKKHVANTEDASGDPLLLGRVFAAAARVARERGLSDYRLVVNNGRGVGQSVLHLHVHLMGGRPFSWPPG